MTVVATLVLAAHRWGALHWDPQLRGLFILLLAVLVLPGSVALLLSTNVGAKMGVLLALTGMSGWIFLLSLIWATGTGNGQGALGDKGQPATWKIKEIVVGDLAARAATPVARQFPKGWTVVPSGNAGFASASASADSYLIPPAPTSSAAGAVPKVAPPFKTTQDYVPLGGYTIGGQNYLFRIGSYKVFVTLGHHHFFIKHQPHYFVMRVQPVVPSVTLAGAATTLPAADPTKPIYSVVMIRDVGSLRKPPVEIAMSSFIIFALCAMQLHRRDKEIMQRRALSPAAA